MDSPSIAQGFESRATSLGSSAEFAIEAILLPVLKSYYIPRAVINYGTERLVLCPSSEAID